MAYPASRVDGRVIRGTLSPQRRAELRPLFQRADTALDDLHCALALDGETGRDMQSVIDWAGDDLAYIKGALRAT